MPNRYEPQNFESAWRQRWKEADLFLTREEPGRPKYYVLEFFPYPSGAGLSVGHCRNYIPSDVITRMKHMQGFNVLHPMGFDAFGLPAENEAIRRQRDPAVMVAEYAANYRRQLDLVGLSYDWSRTFASCEPSYYRWTQWIFKKLFESGLAYQHHGEVNWCPKDKTALANEEVVGGLCERCGTPVEKKAIPQWYFKITEYAQRLIDDLDELEWPEGIKNQQRNWIGRSEGVEFELKVADLTTDETDGDFEVKHGPASFRVFTTRIDTILGMTFCVLAPEHPLVKTLINASPAEKRAEIETYVSAAKNLSDTARQATDREKTGCGTGFQAINPANGKRVPIWIADYVLTGYGTGAIMAVPGHDERDFEFATKFGIPVLQVISDSPDGNELPLPFASKDGYLVNSGEYNGQSVAESQAKLATWIEALGIGERKVNYRIRDWLISRQRYWGCPIPIIHAADGSLETVPDDQLPVMLPKVDHYEPSGDGSSPLATIPEFVNVTDSEGRLARRETDTMSGFACSSWYFLRFCDPMNDESAWDPAQLKEWMPVDCYVGGAEHAVMHLLYARFWTKVLYDLGLVPIKEPFNKLANQGQVLALTPYRQPHDDEKLDVGEEGILVSFDEAKEMSADALTWKWARMSKSKGNVVTPDEAVEQFGADALRVFECFVAPFEAEIQWSNEGIQGSVRFLSRVFAFVDGLRERWQPDWKGRIQNPVSEEAKAIRRQTHKLILKATSDIERFAFNTYISSMMVFLNELNELLPKLRQSEEIDLALSEAMETIVLTIAPVAPHTADEIWSTMLNRSGFTYLADWPIGNPDLCVESTVTVAVQVNGKLRLTLDVEPGTSQEVLLALANESDRVTAFTSGKTVRKVIHIADKLLNIVVS